MLYHIHSFVGSHASVARMVTEYCNQNKMRVHTFMMQNEGTYTVFFEKVVN